jgi:hypothetical protein
MAIVNIDLSEYDAVRKRNSELEEQVRELKKLNESLKQGAKVILRKETTLLFNKPRTSWYDNEDNEPQRKNIESSESYVNFEDVRLKVEQAMQDEVNRSIHDRNMEKQAYADKKNKLDNKYKKKAKDLEVDYSRKEIELRNKYSAMVTNFESEKLRILNLLPNIRKLAEELHDDLVKRFFMPKHAVELAESIMTIAND